MKEYSLTPKEFAKQISKDIFIVSQLAGLEKTPFNSDVVIGCYLTTFFSQFEDEHAFAFFFNRRMKFIDSMHIQGDGAEYCYPLIESVEQRGIELKASVLILAHNHPGSPPIPSCEDVELTGEFVKYFKNSKIKLLDHYIVSGVNFRRMLRKAEPEYPDIKE